MQSSATSLIHERAAKEVSHRSICSTPLAVNFQLWFTDCSSSVTCSAESCVLGVQGCWHMLVAVLRMLQEGGALSREMAHAIATCIVSSLAEILHPRPSLQILRSHDGLAWSLALLRATEHPTLTLSLMHASLSLLGMRAHVMPWVREAAERLAVGGHLSQVCPPVRDGPYLQGRSPHCVPPLAA